MIRRNRRLTPVAIGPTLESGRSMAAAPQMTDASPSPVAGPRRRLVPILLSLATVFVVGMTGVWASTALLSDHVSLPSLPSHGGTLHLGVTQPDVRLPQVDLQGVLPGDHRSRSFTVNNTGSLPGALAFRSEGVDSGSCFSYSVLDNDAGGAVVVPSRSLGQSTDAPLLNLPAGASRHYTIDIAMSEACAVNGATGRLSATMSATQVDA
jgi:hypothetical protein